MLVAGKASGRVAKCIFNQIEAKIEDWTTKMSKKRIFCKKLQESMG